MKKNSHRSMGSRLGKMKTLREKVKTFYDYEAASEDITLTRIDALIDSVETQDADAAGKLAAYTRAVEIRQKGFTLDEDSIYEMVDKIASTVAACIAISPKEAAAIKAMAVKIRGAGGGGIKKKPAKPGEKPAAADPSGINIPDKKSISRSDRTFGNMIKTFDNIIATLQSYGTRYTGKKNLALQALQDQSTACHAMNAKADETIMELRLSRKARDKGFAQIASTYKRIIKGIRGQYGIRSTQYLSVK